MNMNDVRSTLVAHSGATKVTREELREIPIPEATKTHQPLAHFEVVTVLEEALSFRHLRVVRDDYAVSQDGMKMFGVMDLDESFDGGRFSIGLRNSNDKSCDLLSRQATECLSATTWRSPEILHRCFISTP